MSNRIFKDIDSILATIDSFTGRPEELVLAISDGLQDPTGISMAIVTDRVLARGWLPAEFEQKDGFRQYHYRGQDDGET